MSVSSVQHDCQTVIEKQQLLTIEQAQAAAIEIVCMPKRQELVALDAALDRIVAKDLFAPEPMPGFNNSAMDGYAVKTNNLKGPGPYVLPVIGGSVAGVGMVPDFDPQSAIRIYTGAAVPSAYDAVIAQEDCRVEDKSIEFERLPLSGANIRHKGSDIRRGDCLLRKGTRIAAHHMGLLAASGYFAINVYAKPRVAIFSTGDELAEPGKSLKAGQIYDCNKPMLIALLAAMGLDAEDLGAVGDNQSVTQNFLAMHKDSYDLIISTGSVSIGDRDFLKSAFQMAGGEITAWRVAIKPGKPVMFGKLGRTVFTGLPGNPFAVFVGFNLFVKPQLLRMCGQSNVFAIWQTAQAGFTWHRKSGRAEVFPVGLMEENQFGVERLTRLGKSVSATLFPLAEADGLAMVPAECDHIKPGDTIQWRRFSQV